MPHDCHVAPRPLARPLGPAYKHHARHAQRHRTRSRSHSPSTHAGAGGWVIKTERARRTMRAVSEMWCVFVNTRLRRFHAVAVSCCGGMLHLWSCVLGTCVGGRPRVAHTMDTTVSFRTCPVGTPGAWHVDGYGRIILPIGATQRTRGTYAPRLPRRPTTPGETPRPLRLAWAVGRLPRTLRRPGSWREFGAEAPPVTDRRTRGPPVDKPGATLRMVGCGRARRLLKPVGNWCP